MGQSILSFARASSATACCWACRVQLTTVTVPDAFGEDIDYAILHSTSYIERQNLDHENILAPIHSLDQCVQQKD